MRDSYKTRQKELIERGIKECQNEFTIKELFTKLNKKGQTIGQTTVYRVVNNLVKNHTIKKSTGDDKVPHYHVVKQCNHSGHCLLKCESCGKLTHTDCNELNVLSKHFKTKHHFTIDQKDIIIYGTCEECRI